ncbi:MAG: tryptophan--tRNA ligase [Candidatus Moranbacteria bacterium RIFCSPLOWO2_02_FULL_48_19]|nr:MAG: tryptophan--tRNA ligase [Candidatus Moranbacteria bacterium RIFCSPLOWO2_02_FULL_48_19]OGI29851.1 MAG: tryptophan--tRNA ligase [Candidatus Moranbacteria bacterium RIFCSPLOWO2_12_FULL_48_12]
MSKRLFSGIQPSGNLHLGNYLGAIQNWVKLQDEYEAIFCVVDLHAITVPQDPVELRKKIIEVAKIYLAAGIDPKKSTMFVQSHISEHTQLAWILSTLTKITELERMTQFKDKSQKDGKEGIGAGLLTYPTLMAADILLYDTAVVPVGEDQVQHIELTRVLARRFNEKFGETFVIPESIVGKKSARIMGLDDPTKKMSKSAASEYNYIALTDDAETVRKKIKKAVTDSGSEIVYSDSKPALKNLLNIFALLYDKKLEAIAEEYAGKNYSDFKNGLAEVIINFLSPFQERLKNISDEEVLAVLRAGAEKVKPLAREKMHQVFDKIGLISY